MSADTEYRLRGDYAIELMEPWRLEPSRTALIIVDMQYATGSWEAGLGRMYRERGEEEVVRWRLDRVEQVVIPNLQRLLAFFRTNGLRVIYVTIGSKLSDYSDVPRHLKGLAIATQNREGNREHQIRDEILPLPGEPVVNKSTISAFHSSNLQAMLRAMDLEYLVFTGISTNMCVDTTARDAVELGFRALLVEDCCGAAKPEYHTAALHTFQRLFGRVEPMAAVMAELSGERA